MLNLDSFLTNLGKHLDSGQVVPFSGQFSKDSGHPLAFSGHFFDESGQVFKLPHNPDRFY